MAKNNSMTGWIILIAVVVVGYFLIAGDNPFAKDDNNGLVPPPAGVVCNKDYTASVTMLSRNAFERSNVVNTDADNVTYQVWELVNGNQIPRPTLYEEDELVIGYGRKFLVVAMTDDNIGDHDVRFVSKEFEVDKECNSPRTEIFYLETVPETISVDFDHRSISVPNDVSNRVTLNQEGAVTFTTWMEGEGRTKTETIIVFDAETEIISEINSGLPTANVPFAHSGDAGTRSYAFELGTFDGFKALDPSFEFRARHNAPTGAMEIDYTIYQYQTGFVHTRTGDWVATKAIENNDNDLLLPTFTGEIFLTIAS